MLAPLLREPVTPLKMTEIRNGNGEAQIGLFEPAAAVRHPPRDVSDGNGRGQGPPDRQNEIGGEPEHSEREPENLALHTLLSRRDEACLVSDAVNRVSTHP